MRTRDLPVFPLVPNPVRSDVNPDVAPVRHEFEAVGSPDGPRVALITLGCDKNTVDSERIMASLVGHGARVSSDIRGAEILIVNTCGFIQDAKEQSVETILDACDLKARGHLNAVVAVGCLVQRYKTELEHEIPEVDFFMGLTELQGLVPELRRRGLLPATQSIPTMEQPLRILSTETPHTSYLKISEGCDHTCAFCAIPLMRGLHRSEPVEDLVREAAGLGVQGVKEINVISQDTTWYGRDRKRLDPSAPLLPDLLRALLMGTDVPWFRLFYMYPSGITSELIELIANEDRILPYLDMPIQHGADRMLRLMRRPERQVTIRRRVEQLRQAIPELTLRTTVILGFPGETDDDFAEMLDFLAEIRFERVGAFAYSMEEGTRAAEMEGHVPIELMNERMGELMDVQREISFEKNAELVGQRSMVLVDEVLEEDGDFDAVARTIGQALDVDGVTNLCNAADVQSGNMIEVEIVDCLDYDLIGKVV